MIAIRITKNRKSFFIYIDYIKKGDWDEKAKEVKKSHPNSARINNYILKKLSEVKNTFI